MTLGVVANPIDLVVPRPHRFHTIFHNTWGGMGKNLNEKKYHSGIFSDATVFAINYQLTLLIHIIYEFLFQTILKELLHIFQFEIRPNVVIFSNLSIVFGAWNSAI